ncbi:MAG TPA: MrtC family glutamic-type intramembrane protease, partial [Polyangiaceae bacterium LLY-WYZ-15_(1-7)]|nr:MrtC family glutamic-type intramembrane protease [Polyangiaceae bacterium LLY-WYZ-15_(1-7)]
AGPPRLDPGGALPYQRAVDPASTPEEQPRPRPVREVLLVYALIAAGTLGLTRLRAIPALAEYVHLLVGGLFLFTALHLAGREGPGGIRRFGIDLGGLLGPPPPEDADASPGPLGLFDLARTVRRGLPSALREVGVAAGLCAVIFPPFAWGFHLWHGAAHPFRWNPPEDFASFAAAQLVVVGLPEEAFFRGFVQTRLGDAWPATRRLLGAAVHPAALLLQAALFALVHVVADPNPARLAVFFPGLVFGWLRGWRGGIGAAIVFHAASNVFSELLFRGWLR